jgi:hypothetical protein
MLFEKRTVDGNGVFVYARSNVWNVSDPAFAPADHPFPEALTDENEDRLYLATQRAVTAFQKRYIAAAQAGATAFTATGVPASLPYVRLVEGGVTFDGELLLVLRSSFMLEYLDVPGGEDGDLEAELG